LTFAPPREHASDLVGALSVPADSPDLGELSKDALLELLARELATTDASKSY
jgi:hypothetical protein